MRIKQLELSIKPFTRPTSGVIPAKAGICLGKTYDKQILDQVEDDGYKGSCSSESGFSPIFVIAGVVLIGVILTVVFMLFGQSGRDGEQNNALVVPPGVVVDEAGAICETQDARFCHETPDIETWKDDGLP